jgi:hypothetical protein
VAAARRGKHNAAMKSFFAMLRKNVLNRRYWAARHEVRVAIVAWFESSYYRRRRQRTPAGWPRSNSRPS